jgi:hypothetical protein
VVTKSLCHSAWSKHEGLARTITWRVVREYGGDYEELFSESLVLFVQACKTWEKDKGSLSNWLAWKIYRGLQERKRTEARHKSITGPIADGELLGSLFHHDKNIDLIWKDLSDDSRLVLHILFGMDVKFRNTSLVRMSLRLKVQKETGWGNHKVTNCFREIEAALT